MSDEIIPREKACIYWNDVPSGIPGDDVMVLSVDDPDRDHKSAIFENSTGAPLVSGFLKFDSAEKIFQEFFQSEFMLATAPAFFDEIWNAWLIEFSKIPDFFAPDRPRTLIERLCRRKCAEYGRDADQGIDFIDTRPQWSLYEPDIRQLVEIIREPSLRMILVGDEAVRCGWSAKEIWQAMVDEALGEKPV